MKWLLELVTNPFLVTALSSWGIAQILKGIIHAIVYKKLDLKRLFGDGGMPSGHSATVCSLAAMTAMKMGFGSFDFALAAIFALVVCRDAMGVRRETGKQAVVINEILDTMPENEKIDAKLKEFIGHTPLQVFFGGILGILNAVVMFFLFFNV